MKNKRKGLAFFIGCLLISIFALTIGATYSFYSASAINSTNVYGNTYRYNVALELNTVKSSTRLVPEKDSDIITDISNASKCMDSDNYEVCSLYLLTITNLGGQEDSLSIYLETLNSTFVTNNLKARLYSYSDGTYIEESDILTLSYTPNVINTFNISYNPLTFVLDSNEYKNYYLAVWVSEAYANQNDDQGKSFMGRLIVRLSSGNEISSQFTVSS